MPTKLEGETPRVPTDAHFALTNVQEKVTKAFVIDSKHDGSPLPFSPLLQSASFFILAKRRDFSFLSCNSYITWASIGDSTAQVTVVSLLSCHEKAEQQLEGVVLYWGMEGQRCTILNIQTAPYPLAFGIIWALNSC